MDTLLSTRPDTGACKADVLDRPHLARYTLGDAALEAEILELFVRQAPVTMSRLTKSCDDRQWREAAHTLKGSARAVGAKRLAATAEACERIDRRTSPGAVEGCLGDVADAYAEVAALIDQICRDAGRQLHCAQLAHA